MIFFLLKVEELEKEKKINYCFNETSFDKAINNYWHLIYEPNFIFGAQTSTL